MAPQEDVTHKAIYDRLLQVESKVDKLEAKTEEVVVAFNSAKAAFTVLEWIAKAAKPILWVVASVGAVIMAWKEWSNGL